MLKDAWNYILANFHLFPTQRFFSSKNWFSAREALPGVRFEFGILFLEEGQTKCIELKEDYVEKETGFQ